MSFYSILRWIIAFNLTVLNVSVCGDTINGELVFHSRAPTGGVAYVASGEVNSIDAVIDQKNKQFTSKVMVGTPKSTAIFKNTDTTDHNIFANDLSYGVRFDVGLIAAGSEATLAMDWEKDSLVRIGCKIHPKMKAYIANIPSNHFKGLEFEKKTLNYKFSITDVAQSDNKFVLLLPKYDKIAIDLNKGHSRTIELLRKGKTKGALTITRQ